MLLRKLELYGFKSFADRTEIEFGSGITAIVGPNGSGKSNITDAIRWVLGEQNVRNLRGAKAEDIIFAGTTKRRPLGVAEVSLIFDNSDGKLPLDFNEVTITRRVFRSGDSEYFINKSSCRLKDIHELLFDTGIGRDSMTVIGQNKIDEVLNAKPEERRVIFEEAAGITKYKYRKKEALRKLEETEQNLIRLNDLVAEIETQLDPLAESAARTLRHNELNNELTSCQVTLIVTKLEKAEKMVESAALERESLTEQAVVLSTKLALAENDKERMTDTLNKFTDEQSRLEQSINSAITDMERTDGKIAVMGERIEQGKYSRERLLKEITSLEQNKERLTEKIAEIKTGIERKVEQLNSIKEVQEHQAALYIALTEQVGQIEQRIEQAKEKTFDSIQLLVDERNKMRTLERDISKIDLQQSNREGECANYGKQLADIQEQENCLKAEQLLTTEWFAQNKQELKSLDSQKQRLEQNLQQLVVQEQKTINRYSEVKSRLNVLTSMNQEYEGFSKGIKNLLKSNHPWRKNIHGAIAEVINVAPKYVTAIEIALGGALQHIITDNDNTAKQAINFLKTNNFGRATFLPLNTVRPAQPRSNDLTAAKANGAIGLASELVECEPCYRPVIEFVLGRTVIVENIDDALRIAKQHAFSVKLVTLDGQQVNPGGSLTGGSTSRRENSLLGRTAEIESLKQVLNQIQDTLGKEQEQSNALRSELVAINQLITNANHAHQEKEVRQAELIAFVHKTETDIQRLKLSLQKVSAELTAYDQERNELSLKLQALAQRVSTLEIDDIQHKEQTVNLQADLKRLKQTREELQSTLTETKIQIAALEQDINIATATCLQYDQDNLEIEQRIVNFVEEERQIGEQLSANSNDLDQLTDLRQQIISKKGELEKQRQNIYNDKLNVMAHMQQLDRDIKDTRRKHQDVQTRLHEIEMIAAKYGYEVDHNRVELQERYSLTLSQAQELCRDESLEVLTKMIGALESELLAIGPVNPAAIEENERLQERYKFFITQSHDLVAAKEYLCSIIQDIDNTMSKQFKVAFAEINKYFGQIFSSLFGGGKAEVILQEPDNILLSGIDIVAQPPGKKLQNLSLLSGGERSLTVIALLYAFLSYRPSPFCVVDEIDAALDEANVQRFSEFLRGYTGLTQFIIVTHRKGTMELADIMQGVTMEESGVSRLISVKFMDEAG